MATYTGADKALQYLFSAVDGIILSATLAAGSTSVTISDQRIQADSLIDIYTDVYGVNPTAAAATTGSLVLTFEAQQTAINIRVRIS